jgi:hypothetical protein
MVELTATADSWLEEEAGGLGSQKELRIGKTSTYPMKRSLIRFSLAGKLPKGITIAGAELSVYQFGATAPTGTVEPNLDREIQVFRVNRSWTETGVTWMTTGTQEEWTEPYLGLNGEDADVTPQDTKLWMYADYGYKTFSLTALVQAWYAEPESNFGVLLRATNEQESGKDIQIRSREYGGSPAQRPTLRIFYQTKIIDPNNPTD